MLSWHQTLDGVKGGQTEERAEDASRKVCARRKRAQRKKKGKMNGRGGGEVGHRRGDGKGCEDETVTELELPGLSLEQ